MGFLRSILLALLVLAGGAFPAAAQNRNVTVVYDVSGSMWGQIDGVAKVTIAREVLGDMLATWPEGRDFGLIAYGHRREGDCGDIEQVVSLGPLDAQSVRAQINALMPRGRTPLTDAVRLAAESMRYQDLPATVILVTDGLETCNADPCALAAELARAGVNFTAHVVGFDIAEGDRAQVACIAEATGGLFVPADNAQELSAALQQVTMAEPEPEPEPDGASLTLRAIDAQSGLPIAGVAWSLLNANTETEESHTSPGESLALTVEPGDYRVTASHDGRSGGATISALLGEGLEVVIELAEDLPEASVQAGAEIAAGSVFEVVWSGPDARQDYITIVPAGAPEADYGDYWRTNRGSPAQLTAPDALGPHEVRYVHQETRRVLAVQPVTLTPVSAALDAPESAIAGAVVEIGFEGPDNPQDYITVVEVGAPEGSYNDYWRTNRGSPAQVTMPDALGNHELRYVIQQSGRTLASRPITLEAASAQLLAPDEVPAGSVVSVEWQGPDNPQDYITVVEAGAPEGSYNDYWRTNRGSPAQVTMPDALGNHELRYVIQQSGRTLASRPITLQAASAQLLAPGEVPAGSVVSVEWQGPDNPQDYITVVEAGAPEGSYNDYWRTNRGNPAQVRMPDALGNYELRYVINQSGRTLASLPVTLSPVTASLEAPETIVPGGQFQAGWQGPDNPQDYITIVEAGAPEGSYSDYWRTNRGSPARLNAPAEPGAYELRYVINSSGRTLASVPVTVGAGQVSVTAVGAVQAGGVITVEWSGPGRFEDFLQIVPAGAADNAPALREARASQGNPLQLFAPPAAGEYELRYRASDSGEVLARTPLRVE